MPTHDVSHDSKLDGERVMGVDAWAQAFGYLSS